MTTLNHTTPTKKCTGPCGRTLPAIEQYFHKQKTGKFGVTAMCKECTSGKSRERRSQFEVKESIRLRSKEYRARSEVKEHNRIYRQQYQSTTEYKQHHSEYMKERRRRPGIRAHILECERNYMRKYREKPGVREYQRDFQRLRRLNPKTKAHAREYYREKYKTDPAFREYKKVERHRRRTKTKNGIHFTAADVNQQIAAQTDKNGVLRCWWCGKKLDPGNMHIDHWNPLAEGGTNDAANIRLMHVRCNLSKGAKHPFKFGRLL